MAGKAPPRGYRKFVRDTFLLVPAERKADALRLTNAPCVTQLRKMLTKVSVDGGGIFYYLEAVQPAARRRGVRSVRRGRDHQSGQSSRQTTMAEPLYATCYCHPSLAGMKIVEAFPDGETATRRRSATALLLSAVRFCDCAEPLDTLVLDASLLGERTFRRLWDAMVVCSEGRLFSEHLSPSDLNEPASSMTPWLRSRSFFDVGAFLCSRIEMLIARFLLEHVVRMPAIAPQPPMRRARAQWFAALPARRRMRLLARWVAELKGLLAQRRRLLSLPGGGVAGSGSGSSATNPVGVPVGVSPPWLPGETLLLLQLLEALSATPSEVSLPVAPSRFASRQPSFAPSPHTNWAGFRCAPAEPALVVAALHGALECGGYGGGADDGATLASAHRFLRIVYERPLSRVGTTLDLSCRRLGVLLAEEESLDIGQRLVNEEQQHVIHPKLPSHAQLLEPPPPQQQPARGKQQARSEGGAAAAEVSLSDGDASTEEADAEEDSGSWRASAWFAQASGRKSSRTCANASAAAPPAPANASTPGAMSVVPTASLVARNECRTTPLRPQQQQQRRQQQPARWSGHLKGTKSAARRKAATSNSARMSNSDSASTSSVASSTTASSSAASPSWSSTSVAGGAHSRAPAPAAEEAPTTSAEGAPMASTLPPAAIAGAAPEVSAWTNGPPKGCARAATSGSSSCGGNHTVTAASSDHDETALSAASGRPSGSSPVSSCAVQPVGGEHRHEAIRIRAADPAAAAAAIWAPPGTLLHSTGHHRSGPPHHHPWGMAATGADGRLDPLEFLLSRFPPQSTLMEEDNDESDSSPLQLPWGLRDIDVSIDVELSEVSERGLSERGLSERGLTESGVGSPAEHEDAGSESHVSLGTPSAHASCGGSSERGGGGSSCYGGGSYAASEVSVDTTSSPRPSNEPSPRHGPVHGHALTPEISGSPSLRPATASALSPVMTPMAAGGVGAAAGAAAPCAAPPASACTAPPLPAAVRRTRSFSRPHTGPGKEQAEAWRPLLTPPPKQPPPPPPQQPELRTSFVSNRVLEAKVWEAVEAEDEQHKRVGDDAVAKEEKAKAEAMEEEEGGEEVAAEEEMVVEVEEEDGRGSWRRRRRQQQEQEQGGDADEDEDGKSFQSAESSSKMNSRWARGGAAEGDGGMGLVEGAPGDAEESAGEREGDEKVCDATKFACETMSAPITPTCRATSGRSLANAAAASLSAAASAAVSAALPATVHPTASPGSALPSASSSCSSTVHAADGTGRGAAPALACVHAENELLREACRRFENDLLNLSASLASCGLAAASHTATPHAAPAPAHPGALRWQQQRQQSPLPPQQPSAQGSGHHVATAGGGAYWMGAPLPAAVTAGQAAASVSDGGALQAIGGAGGASGTSVHFSAASQLAAAAARLSACSAHLSQLAAQAALRPLHTTYAMLSEDIRRYEARCTEYLSLHAPVHNAAISKVRSVVTLLWPRAQVKTFGSFATGLMRPGSDIDLIVTLPPVRTTTAMPEAPGTLEGRNALPEETWQGTLARCLVDQAWVIPESVKQIDALVPIVSFATRFAVGQSQTPLRLDVSFEGVNHNGLATNVFVSRTLVERPDVKPLTLVLKQFLAERSLDKPYLGGLSSYGLLLLVLRFLQAQDGGQGGLAAGGGHVAGLAGGGLAGGAAGVDDAEQSLGARLVKLLDYYGRGFDPRNMGISVVRNRGEGEYIMRHNGPGDVNRPMRVDLSQLHLATVPPGCAVGGQQGWAGLQAIPSAVAGRPLARGMQYGSHSRPASEAGEWGGGGGGVRPRPASEAGDWCPPPVEPRSPQVSPAGVGHPRTLSLQEHATPVHGVDWPLHRPMRAAQSSNLARYAAFRQHSVVNGGGGANGAWAGGVADTAAKFWFDPLYVEDPLRPSNNVGRNCFRMYVPPPCPITQPHA